MPNNNNRGAGRPGMACHRGRGWGGGFAGQRGFAGSRGFRGEGGMGRPGCPVGGSGLGRTGKRFNPETWGELPKDVLERRVACLRSNLEQAETLLQSADAAPATTSAIT